MSLEWELAPRYNIAIYYAKLAQKICSDRNVSIPELHRMNDIHVSIELAIMKYGKVDKEVLQTFFDAVYDLMDIVGALSAEKFLSE